jgi:ankyrin repeat protein
MSNIFQAAEEGDLARVEELLAQGGLNLAAFHSAGHKLTALNLAARNGHLDVAMTLIRAGAPLHVPDESFSPLHGAVMYSHHDLAAMLLREGADVNSFNRSRATPLCHANDNRIVPWARLQWQA